PPTHYPHPLSLHVALPIFSTSTWISPSFGTPLVPAPRNFFAAVIIPSATELVCSRSVVIRHRERANQFSRRWNNDGREKIPGRRDRKSTRLNSSHLVISYA